MSVRNEETVVSTPSSPGVLTLSPLVEAGVVPGDVAAMIIEASLDETICDMNYLPHAMDAAQAQEYCAKSDGVVLRLDGKPVGVTMVRHTPQPGEGVEIPAGCVELDEWVLAPFRGQGILGRRGWPLITAWLAQRFTHVVSVTWEDNYHAQALLRGRGYKWVGRGFWSGSGYTRAGYCEVFVYDLTPHREKP